jgi:hypothetical protein
MADSNSSISKNDGKKDNQIIGLAFGTIQSKIDGKYLEKKRL